MSEENSRIEEFAAELRRRSAEDEGNAQENSSTLSRDIDSCINGLAEKIAKEKKLWFDFSDILSLGMPAPSGVENDVYLSNDSHTVYKVNNLMTSRDVLSLLERLILHNSIFPQTSYELYGFTGFGNGSIYPVMYQNYIANAHESTPVEIDTYMAALGFYRQAEASYTNGKIIISDLRPRNVLRDIDGDLYVVDADFKLV